MNKLPGASGTVAVSALTLALTASVAVAATATKGHGGDAQALGPTVTHTGRGPTGYSVTFRIKDADATAMKIKGSWSFASSASTKSDPLNNSAISAADWTPGDFPLQSPDRPGEAWPVASMTKDTATGIWSYTVPLPSGVFDYQFYPDCAATGTSVDGCTAITDPANLAFNTDGTTTQGSAAVFSQVYVPSDSRFGTQDYSWLTDVSKGKRGTLTDVEIPSTVQDSGTDRLAVYTPPGYDADRATPYPVFVLSHGGGETEIAWPTRGRIQQIADHLIAEHKMQPAIIVMPNVGGPGNFGAEVGSDVLPYVEANYDVTTSSSGRAIAGNSAFGGATNNVLFSDDANFGYYGVFSPANGAPDLTVTDADGDVSLNPAYSTQKLGDLLGLEIAVGQQDLSGDVWATGAALPTMTATTERMGFIQAGIGFSYFTEGGGHTWAFWQDAVKDFLTTSAFRTTTTSITGSGARYTASVTAATAEPATPTGTVQFLVDGVETGHPVRLSGGTATLHYTGSGTVTAVYHGDR
ncbi:MAG: alpha/beta hydrolase-fold protein, partial [Nocardioides sp.]|uniref:alpha/beta hydrolase-fold protein n=1 Tax=Nocardioides sp. TaxID=35761 RepID=UPI0039E33E99